MEEEEKYYLGIEATGRTVAMLADADGEVLGKGQAGNAIYSQVGQERSEQALWTAIIGAFAGAGFNTRDLLQAGQTLPNLAAICIGMTGVERPKDENQVRRLLNTFNFSKNMIVTSEAHIVLEAGFLPPEGEDEDEAGYGVAVLGGESGLAFGKGREGQTARAGGGGYLLGDEGSSHYLGLQAVKAVLRAADGRGEATSLTGLVEAEWKLPTNRPDTLSQRVYTTLAGLGTGGNKAQIEESTETYKRALANLAPLVERAAASGDGVASAILDETADALAQAVRAVIERTGLNQSRPAQLSVRGLSLQLPPGVGQPVAAKIPLVIYGSVLMSNSGELRRRLQERLPQCDDPIAALNPAEGALRLALHAG